MMVSDFTGRFNGEAFVQFETLFDATKALERHKQKLSSRFVLLFFSLFSLVFFYFFIFKCLKLYCFFYSIGRLVLQT